MGGKIAFLGIPNKGEENHKCSPTKGNKIRSGCLSGAQKRAEMLHHPCILGDPQHRGTKSEVAASPLPSRGPKRGRKCYVTPAFSGPLQKGTETKVAHKRAEVLCHPCILGGPQTRGQSQRWPSSGQKCYVTPTYSGVPKKGPGS